MTHLTLYGRSYFNRSAHVRPAPVRRPLIQYASPELAEAEAPLGGLSMTALASTLGEDPRAAANRAKEQVRLANKTSKSGSKAASTSRSAAEEATPPELPAPSSFLDTLPSWAPWVAGGAFVLLAGLLLLPPPRRAPATSTPVTP